MVKAIKRAIGFNGRLWQMAAMRHCMPCVGFVVFLGCFTCVIVPESEEPQKIVVSPDFSIPTVILDPGHGGHDEGAASHGLREKDLTLDLALRVEQMLRSADFPVILTRRDDTYMSLPERAEMANRFDKSIFVSLHFNESSEPSATGVETFYADQKVSPEDSWMWVGLFSKPEMPPLDNGEVLASFIQAALVMKVDVVNRGIKSRSLYVVRNVRNPAVLVEGGFISNPLEARLLMNSDYRQRLAGAIAEGIVNYEKTEHFAPAGKLAKAQEERPPAPPKN